ncbi:hypothetical protein GCM10010371_47310 [Streptomyces subrutilus]|uniref:Fructose-bisphosphate aldolase n=1 Tax=Streptomyces subrutilus TaxID=36818 RepID=A0A5P2UT88_9ACTN|nr:hypothetical protein CP968_33770 [Streptomyces subrutilus]GGZ82111.1 hypothetical protein GCM10010371_47310 [Streptomyces subrutilus]
MAGGASRAALRQPYGCGGRLWAALAAGLTVGCSHAELTRDALLDLDLIARLKDRLELPLVLHGSSGVDDEHLAEAVGAGMTKVNVSTHLNKIFTGVAAPRAHLGPARDAVAHEVARLLRTLAGA